jgi:hypothetical protein
VERDYCRQWSGSGPKKYWKEDETGLGEDKTRIRAKTRAHKKRKEARTGLKVARKGRNRSRPFFTGKVN